MSVERVLLVTGGSRGIGAATARLAASRGYAVCINYRQDHRAAGEIVSHIECAGGRAAAVQADVSIEAEVVGLFQAVDRDLGPLRALVNNAGMLERQGRVEDMDAGRIGRVFATNVTGAFICAREAVKRMSTRHGGAGGAIVNVSSRAAALGSAGEYVDYAAAKAAVDTLTIGLAREVADEGVRVNAVRAGVILTGIHASGGEPGRADRIAPSIPMKRAGQVEEVARAILWLLSDEASYCTGAILDVSGGR